MCTWRPRCACLTASVAYTGSPGGLEVIPAFVLLPMEFIVVDSRPERGCLVTTKAAP